MINKRLFILALIIALVSGYLIMKYFSIDRSGEFIADDEIKFKGEEYKSMYFAHAKVGKTIGKVDYWDINEIKEDKEHNFLEVCSFLDNFYVVKKSYTIPTQGSINVVYIDNYRYTNNVELKNAIYFLLNTEINDGFKIKTDNIYHYAKEVYIGYDDCPVGTEYIGMIGYINEKLVYIKPTERIYSGNGSPEEQIYYCYIIPNQYKAALDIYPYYIKDSIDIVE